MFGSLAAADLFNRGSTSFPCPGRPEGEDDETLSSRPLCLMVLSNKLCAGLNVYERRARERARETENKNSWPNWFILSHDGISLQTYVFTRMPKQKKNICLVCLNVYTSINSQTVNALRMTAFVCVCLCVWYACLWVGYVTGRQ